MRITAEAKKRAIDFLKNEKLIDRCIRLTAELAEIPSEDACFVLHQSIVKL
jgi:N-acetylmuramic acid 6-phosphate (MurNAc-6-P) etherase